MALNSWGGMPAQSMPAGGRLVQGGLLDPSSLLRPPQSAATVPASSGSSGDWSDWKKKNDWSEWKGKGDQNNKDNEKSKDSKEEGEEEDWSSWKKKDKVTLKGDWYCPKCEDLQFARNISCRKCGSPNPDPVGGAQKPGDAIAGGKGEGVLEDRPGDWTCPKCGDHVFAKNVSCRRCGTANPDPAATCNALAAAGKTRQLRALTGATDPVHQMATVDPAMAAMSVYGASMSGLSALMGGAMGSTDPSAAFAAMDPNMAAAMSAYIYGAYGSMGAMAGNPAMAALGLTDPASMNAVNAAVTNPYAMMGAILTQSMVQQQTTPLPKPGDWLCPSCGDLRFARDATCRRCGTTNPCPTAVTGTGGTQTKLPGDWNCPNCNDHVFARNANCRRCGTANPHPASNQVGDRRINRDRSRSR